MAARILSVSGIEGVTYSGGEPTVQAHGLALLSEWLRAAGLTVVSYTGYTLEALQARADLWINRFLSTVDILIDGPYVQAKAVNLLWRGSSNQRVHFLTDAYRHLADQVDHGPAKVEFIVDSEGFITTGTWTYQFPKSIRNNIEEIIMPSILNAQKLCPFCLEKVNFKQKQPGGYPCPNCGQIVPAMYVDDYKLYPPVVVSTIGFPGHGKTVYLSALFHTLKYGRLAKYWPGFYYKPINEQSLDTVFKYADMLEKGNYRMQLPEFFLNQP